MKASPLERSPRPASLPLLLDVQDLQISFPSPQGQVRVVDGLSFSLPPGGSLALVGESGCGKSVTARALMGLLRGAYVQGRILFRGIDLQRLSKKERRLLRGSQMALVFQEHQRALHPLLPVGVQLGEMLRAHRGWDRKRAREEALRLLAEVGLQQPELRYHSYPHQLSGGMCQRVMIAMAVACRPSLLIADEPTTALDAGVREEILDLLGRLRTEVGMGLLLISHDLSVVSSLTDRMAVMYCGRIVEEGPVEQVLRHPRHPYTEGLLACLPRPGIRLVPIPGGVPELWRRPPGCAFHPRCPKALPTCRLREPPLQEVTPGRRAACLLLEEGKDV